MPTRRSLLILPALAAASTARARGASADPFSFAFPALDGGEIRLDAYRGRALLVVNTASRCGYTPQFAGLQELWTRYRDRGLVVIGVPSNDFGQELSSPEEIGTFCDREYGVTFPMAKAQVVRGRDPHPFYRWAHAERGEAPRWNFHKFVVARDGTLAGSFPSDVRPTDPRIVVAIERALAAAPAGRKISG